MRDELIRHVREEQGLGLAYVLFLSLTSLEAAISGRMPVSGAQYHAIKEMTTLSRRFFERGELVDLPDRELVTRYLPVIRLFHSAGISPETLAKLLEDLQS